MFLAVKKFWKVIFGSYSNCKLVDVKNRSHDSPGAWERFILDSQTTTSMSLGQKGDYKSMSKPWDNSSISHPSPIHHHSILHPSSIHKFTIILPKPQFWRRKAKSRSIEGEEVRSNKKAATWRLGFTIFFLFALFFLFVYLGFISIMFVNSAMRE